MMTFLYFPQISPCKDNNKKFNPYPKKLGHDRVHQERQHAYNFIVKLMMFLSLELLITYQKLQEKSRFCYEDQPALSYQQIGRK